MRTTMSRNIAWLLLCLSAVWGSPSLARDEPMPFEAKWQHLGVATCAGSNCHGSQRPFDDSPVLQNEYFLWQREDAHSNAYKLLLSPAGKRIGANLGIKDVTAAEECLTCHTDYVAAPLRGRRYSMSEGVSCEACHGGAQSWLGPHVSGNTHEQNLEMGLYPLEDPVARARVCLHCHMGTTSKPIDHRMMGAGHPPLEFELDTFTNIQPAHFRVDADYKKRKPRAVSGSKLWAIGQLIAAETFLDGLLDARFADHGMFPELVFFDCNACHHAMRPPRWSPGAGGPLGPGEPRLADSYLVMSAAAMSVLLPESAKQWDAGLNGLHRGSKESIAKIRESARSLRQLTQGGLTALNSRRIDKAETIKLIEKIAQVGIDQRSGDYTSAKQVYYGVEALLASLKQDHGAPKDALKSEVDALFAAVDAQKAYDPNQTQDALRRVRSAVANLR